MSVVILCYYVLVESSYSVSQLHFLLPIYCPSTKRRKRKGCNNRSKCIVNVFEDDSSSHHITDITCGQKAAKYFPSKVRQCLLFLSEQSVTLFIIDCAKDFIENLFFQNLAFELTLKSMMFRYNGAFKVKWKYFLAM